MSTQLVHLDLWLRVLEEEYLSDFIPAGGSAVKFVSGTPETLDGVGCNVRVLAERHGFHHAFLDPGRLTESGRMPYLHRTDRFFLSLTSGIDWKACAAEQARKLLTHKGIELRGRELNDLDGIANDNGRSRDQLLNELQRELTDRHLKDHGMGSEFRNALFALIHRQLVPETITPTTEEVLLKWFRGAATQRGHVTLKSVRVYERISGANAWTMLRSFTHWLPQAGRRGMVAVLDLRPYEMMAVPQTRLNSEVIREMEAARRRGTTQAELEDILQRALARPAVVYRQAAYARMLALLRHLIDAGTMLERTLLVVLSSPDYYSDPAPGRRTFFDYEALQTRIGLEVHDARRGNPCAALAHLGVTP